jgi:hypothetical protein
MELYVPANAPWYAEFKSELLSFPAGKYDDQVDALGLIGQLQDQLEEAVASRIQGPKTVRRMVVEACADLPAEAPDELLICRVIVTPPEWPADKPIPESTQSLSPRIEQARRR